MTDTTTEAVERLAKSLAFVANRTGLTVEKCEEIADEAAAPIRALAAELATAKELIAILEADQARAEAAEAEVERLRDALSEIATDEHPLGWIAITALQEKTHD